MMKRSPEKLKSPLQLIEEEPDFLDDNAMDHFSKMLRNRNAAVKLPRGSALIPMQKQFQSP